MKSLTIRKERYVQLKKWLQEEKEREKEKIKEQLPETVRQIS